MPTPNYTPLAPGQAPTYGTSGAGVAAYQQQLNQQNAGQAGWTPLTVDGFYGNLTQQAANFQPQQQGGAITPASLQPANPINVPTGNPQTTPPITQNVADTFLSTLDLNANEKAAQTSQESLVAKMLANIQNQQGESAYKSQLLQNSGLNTLKQDLQKYNSQILQKQAELNQSDIQLVNNMRNEERRDTLAPFAQMGQAKLAGDAAILRGLKTAEIGVLNALAIGKQGDIQLAKETIQEAVDAKYAPYKEQNALYKAQLEAIQPFLDKAEKKQAAAQTFKLNQAMKEIDKISDFQKTALSNAISNNAPQSIINKINNAKTIQEISSIGSQYLVSKADRLEQQLKGLQIAKASQELGTGSKTSKENASAAQQAQSKLDVINGALKNTGGMRGVVGPNALARAGFGNFNTFTGVEGDFIANINQLTNQETLTSLLDLKKAGGTLGALSEGEGKLLAQAATKINSWAQKDKAGNVTGYKTTEAAFKRELDTIKNLTKKAIIAAGGTPVEEPVTLDEWLGSVGNTLNSSNNLYSNAGYPIN